MDKQKGTVPLCCCRSTEGDMRELDRNTDGSVESWRTTGFVAETFYCLNGRRCGRQLSLHKEFKRFCFMKMCCGSDGSVLHQWNVHGRFSCRLVSLLFERQEANSDLAVALSPLRCCSSSVPPKWFWCRLFSFVVLVEGAARCCQSRFPLGKNQNLFLQRDS